jgi:tocopherol cyclase
VDLPGPPGNAFALIYALEDPGAAASPAARALAGPGATPAISAQVMGPGDGYVCHYSTDVSSAWADAASLSLGAAFVPAPGAAGAPSRALLRDPAAFDSAVAVGFEAGPTWHCGRLTPQERGAAGILRSTVDTAAWAFGITPTAGWGDAPPARQRATAGWLAALPVFEPHWQVCMARGLATGWFEWGGERYDFKDAPAYAEKNWGGGFPSRWWWVQCDAWAGDADAALTAVGARRRLPTPPGLPPQWEDVGMVGLHVAGRFFELVPWAGDVGWDVDPWGRWRCAAENETHAVEVEAVCRADGTPLRAPTADRGLAVLCRDSFAGRLTVRLYEKGTGAGAPRRLVTTLESDRAAVEVGGGPWARPWAATARMREPFRSLVKAGVDPARWPARLRPPGL